MGMACVSGSCTGVCTPGTMMCTSDTQIKTCDMTGNWGSPITCPGEACVNNECTGNCSPGAMQCLGDQPQLCESDGGWGDNGPTCSGGCTSGCGGTDATLDTGFMCGGNGCGQNSDCCPMAPYCPNSGTGTGNCTTLMCQGDGGVCETTSDCCAPLSCAGAELAGGFDSGVPTPGACQ